MSAIQAKEQTPARKMTCLSGMWGRCWKEERNSRKNIQTSGEGVRVSGNGKLGLIHLTIIIFPTSYVQGTGHFNGEQQLVAGKDHLLWN
jgi:hypothetical protein